MVTNNQPLKRTKFLPKLSLNEITEFIPDNEKAKLLSIQNDIQAKLINIKKDIYLIGESLFEAKQILEHGMFIPWIEQTFDKELPYSTAHFYMKVYSVFKESPATIQYIPTKYLLMITNKEFPAEIVKLLNENLDKIDKKGLQQINEVYKEFKDGQIGSNQFLKLANKQISLGMDILKGRAKHRLNTNSRRSFELGTGDILKRINSIRKTARDMAIVYPIDPDSSEHKELITFIDKTIEGLQELKKDMEDSKGLFKHISTEDGNKMIENI